MTERRLRVGVAGLGRAFLLMMPTLVRHPNIRLVAATDPRAEALARFATDFAANTYASVQELCADPNVDAVYVATPHQYHAQHVEMAASAGKHVLVDKPMALTLDECRAMTEAVPPAGVPIVIRPTHRFVPTLLQTRAIIKEGIIRSF